MDASLNLAPGEITYLFQSINTAQWHGYIRMGAVVIALFVTILYLYYSAKVRRTEKSFPTRRKKEA